MKITLPRLALTVLMSLVAVRAESAESGFTAGIAVGRSSVDGRAKTPSRITVGQFIPDDVPIGSLPFKGANTTWSAFVGYTANPYLGVELGFWDHGRFDTKLFVEKVGSLGIKEWYLGTTLTYPLVSKLSLSASIGVSRVQFDADGSINVLVTQPGAPFPPFPPVAIIANVPFATPDDETGGYWRAGLNWRFSNSLDAGLSYGKHDVQVLQVESLALSLRYAF